jgi:hypothetical protein
MIRAIASAAVLSVLAFGPVHAGPITNTVDPTNVFLEFGSSQTSITFVHDITGDPDFQIGDLISSASITIRLAELVTTGENNETFRLSIGAQTPFECLHGNCVPNPGRQEIIALTAAALSDLASDGKIDITIQALSGGFYFADSTLTAEVVPNPEVTASVPVPSTLLLLGAGLMGLGLRPLRRGA